MGALVKGDVVVVPFPFTDLSRAKRRPALVVANLGGEDTILCQITSRGVREEHAVHLPEDGFEEGGLGRASHVRPNKVFTAHKGLVLYRVARLRAPAMHAVTDALVSILRG